MAIIEQHARRDITQDANGITAIRVWLVDWAERYDVGVGTEPHRLPFFNESHPDFSVNPEMEKCKMIKRKISEARAGNDNSGPLKCLITCDYSTRPIGVISITANTISFADTDPDTILDSGNGFIIAGFRDGLITINGSASNDGSYTIDTAGVAAGVLTLVGGDSLTPEGAGNLITITQKNKQLITTIEMGSEAFMVKPNGDWTFVDAAAAGKSNTYADHVARDVPVGVLVVSKVVDSFPWDDVRPLYGSVNNAEFYGAAIGQVLFEGVSVREDRDESGDSIWWSDYRFKYRSVVWNYFWFADKSGGAGWSELKDQGGGGSTIYTLGDFSTLEVE